MFGNKNSVSGWTMNSSQIAEAVLELYNTRDLDEVLEGERIKIIEWKGWKGSFQDIFVKFEHCGFIFLPAELDIKQKRYLTAHCLGHHFHRVFGNNYASEGFLRIGGCYHDTGDELVSDVWLGSLSGLRGDRQKWLGEEQAADEFAAMFLLPSEDNFTVGTNLALRLAEIYEVPIELVELRKDLLDIYYIQLNDYK